MTSAGSHQFTCSICDQGFEQKSRLERHMATSHPPRAPSAVDVEKVLSGIQYPKTKEDLVQYTSQESIIGKDLFDLIKSLPSRTYRDSADVTIAIGELKSAKRVRTAEEVQARTAKQERRKDCRYIVFYFCSCYCKKLCLELTFQRQKIT
jgi:hypothetical protein